MSMRVFLVRLAVLLVVAGCSGGDAARRAGASEPPPLPPPAAWRTNPSAGVTLSGTAPLTVRTGPATILWPAAEPLRTPPYTVRATLRKRTGRLHEGIGIIFGGNALDAPEARQGYSYFFTRGDGSFLIKERRGAATPIVRDWTANPAIRRDTEDGGQTNELLVRVGTREVAFSVNGAEMARLPAATLQRAGRAGLRISHELTVDVLGFTVAPGAEGVR